MRQLFEYLISKENKKNVSIQFEKKLLTPGDIVKLRSLGWMVYFTFDTLKSIKNAKISISMEKVMNIYNGGFISFDEGAEDYNYIGLKSFSDTLEDTMYGCNVEEVYPGEIPFKEISEYTESNIEKESKKRKGIKI